MSKKDSKVSEAQFPTPPRVEQFIGVLQECKDKKEDTKEPINSNMFEDDSDHEDQIKLNRKTQEHQENGVGSPQCSHGVPRSLGYEESSLPRAR